ncbi:MAG TPA: hypothetical protein VGA13_01490 [Acidimicrobiales bacterium]
MPAIGDVVSRFEEPGGARFVAHHRENGVAVVEVSGALDRPSLDDLTTVVCGLGASCEHVVVDLDLATIIDARTTLRSVVRLALDDTTPKVCLVCGRVTARILLDRAGVSAVVPVFQSVGDALQAVVMEREGFGRGWQAEP